MGAFSTSFLPSESGTTGAPYIAAVPGWVKPIANTNWSTPRLQTAVMGSAELPTANGTVGNSTEFDVFLVAGTHRLDYSYQGHTVAGIATVYIDGVSVGTIDGYNAGGASNGMTGSITGIVVATSGIKRVKFSVESKNASASAYWFTLQSGFAFVRTGN